MLGDTPGQMGVIQGLPSIIEKLFYSGYTPINTIIYGVILAIVVFGIIKMFKYFDKRPMDIIISIIPFILLGSSTRALVDAGIYPYNIFLISPGIYIVVGVFTIVALITSIFIEKNVLNGVSNNINNLNGLNNLSAIDYHHILAIIGLIAIIPNLFNFQYMNFNVVAQVFIVWGLVSILTTCIVIIFNIFNCDDNNISTTVNIGANNTTNTATNITTKSLQVFDNQKINLAIIFVHIFDATSTFVAVDFYNYAEQHVVPNVFLELANSAITMFPLKIIVMGAVLYSIDKYIDDVYSRDTLKLAVFILGLAPGLRNFLTLAFGAA